MIPLDNGGRQPQPAGGGRRHQEGMTRDNVSYHGRTLTILWDKTGLSYHQGPGLRVLADGKEIAHGGTLKRLSGKLP